MAIIKKTTLVEQGADKAFDPIIEKYKALDKAQNELISNAKEYQAVLNSIKKTNDGSEAKKLVAINEKLVTTNKELTAVGKERIKVRKQLETALAKSQTAQELNNKQLIKAKVAAQETTKAIKAQAREELKLIGAHEKLTKKTNDAQKRFKDLAAQFGVSSKQAKKARIEFDKLDNELRQVNNAAKDGRRDVGRYGTALKGVGSQLLGAAGIVGGVQLLVDGFQKFAQTAKVGNELVRKIKTNFNVTNKEAKSLASSINAIASTFEEDYNEVLIAANTVSKEFGITGAEATKLIEDGFLKGSNNSGEFLDILKEYPAQFKSVGLDAETSFAIINQQVKEGIYSDKGVDSIKEAGLRLRENTKAVQEALAPLDASVKAQIKQEIAAGNSFKAIQLVSKALKDTSLSAQQTQTIIADVFGGPGEDAGLRYLQSLSDINTNLEEAEIQASELQQANLELSESWNNFVLSVTEGSGILSKALSSVIGLFSGLLQNLATVNDETATGQEKLKSYKDILENANPVLKFFGDTIGKLVGWFVKLNPGMEEALQKFREWVGLTDTSGSAVERINRIAQEYIKTQDESTKKTDENTEKTKTNTKSKKENRDAIKRQNNAIAEQVRLLGILDGEIEDIDEAFESIDISDVTGPEDNQEVINLQKRLEFERQILQTKLQTGILTKQQYEEELNLINTVYSAQIFAARKAADDETVIQDSKRAQELEKEKEQAKKKLEINQALEEAKKELAFSTIDEISSFFSDAVARDTEQEIQSINDKAEIEKDILKDQLEKGLITEAEFKAKSEAIDKKARKDAAKAEKDAALFQIGINTAAGIVKALASSPPPFNFINAGLIAAQGAIKAALVAAQPLPAFAEGTESVPLGNNKKGKDTIIARVNEGERIVPTHLNNQIPSGVTNEMLPDVIKRGLFLNNTPGMTAPQKDSLLASLLMQGNRQSEQVLTALLNGMGHTRPGKNFDTYTNARGEIQKIYK